MSRYRTEISPREGPRRILLTLESLGIYNGKLLDVGAGYGWVSEYFHEHGFSVTPLEPNPIYAQTIEQKTGLTVMRSFFESWAPEQAVLGTFDVVIMTQVIEHVLHPHILFEKTRQLLRHGGLLMLSTPNFDSLLIKILKEQEGHICPPEHLNFFTPKSLRLLGSRYGYRSIQAYTRSNITRHLAVEGTKEYLARGTVLEEAVGTIAWITLGVADRLGIGRYLYAYFVLDDPDT